MKKIFLSCFIFLISATTVLAANNLWGYYSGNLPSLSERAQIYSNIASDQYVGSQAQNIKLLNYLQNNPDLNIGSAIPVVPSLFETSLASAIGTADASMTLVSGTDRQGNALSGYFCFTLDGGTNNVEYVCGTVAGTAVTSMIRGIDPITGVTSVTALEYTHRRGASVKVTDYPTLTILARELNGNDYIPNLIYFNTGIGQTFSSTTAVATQGYVNNVGAGGFTAANVFTNGGLTAMGTSPATVAFSTSTASGLYLNSGVATINLMAAANGYLTIDTSGKLGIATTSNITWGGQHTFNATSTFVGRITSNTATTTVYNDLLVMGSIKQNGTRYGATQVCSGLLTESGTDGYSTETVTCGFQPSIIQLTGNHNGNIWSKGTSINGVNQAVSQWVQTLDGSYTAWSTTTSSASLIINSNGTMHEFFASTTPTTTGFTLGKLFVAGTGQGNFYLEYTAW